MHLKHKYVWNLLEYFDDGSWDKMGRVKRGVLKYHKFLVTFVLHKAVIRDIFDNVSLPKIAG